METRTYNTIVTSKELEVLNNDNKQRFYTSNGWQGSKYDIKKGAKEVAKELRSYIKANPDLNACKWSIRSTRGMCADSLYISMMVAPFEPFTQEYKEKHEYRYNRGYSEHGTIKDYTSPEAYKLMMKVKAFVMQYIHDDSDVMTDYFDRNIYDHYEIGQYDKPFQLIEKKESTKQAEPSREPNEAKISEPIAMPEGLEIVGYSEKAIAVFGDTKAIKDQLKELSGRFNPSLNYNGVKCAGWIFSKKQADKVKELVEATKLSEPVSNSDNHKKKRGKSLQNIIDQVRRLNGYAGHNWYWNFKREKLINKIYTILPALPEEIYIPELSEQIDNDTLKDEKKCTLRDFVIKYGFEALRGKKILLQDNKIVYVHENLLTPDKINDFKDYEKQPYKFRLYGGNTPDAELVEWIYSSDLVIFSEASQGNNTSLIIDDDTEIAHDKEEKRDPKKAFINSKLKEFKEVLSKKVI